MIFCKQVGRSAGQPGAPGPPATIRRMRFPAPVSEPAPVPARPCLRLQTLDRGDGLLGLRPCGPVLAPARTPLFGARGPQVTLAWLDWLPGGAPAGPAALSAALARLQQAHQPSQLPERLAAFGLSGGGKGGWMRWFATHPPLDERIEALRRAA
jgi:hypothetical protein